MRKASQYHSLDSFTNQHGMLTNNIEDLRRANLLEIEIMASTNYASIGFQDSFYYNRIVTLTKNYAAKIDWRQWKNSLTKS